MSVLRRWLPVVAWSAVILAASSDRFSMQETGSFLKALLERDLSYVAQVLLRKLGHLTGYGILGGLALRATRFDFRRPLIPVFAIVLAVASTDELRQATTRFRTGTPWDVVIDLIGAAIVVAWMEHRRRKAVQE